MINLIPNHEKKKKLKDFYFRFAVVLLSLIGVCAVIGAVSLLPAYFLSTIGRDMAETKLIEQKKYLDTAEDKATATTVADLDKKLRLVQNFDPKQYIVSEKIINEVLLRKTPDIRIIRIVYENNAAEGREVKVSGVAPSRERLLLFRRALETAPAWKEVDLPISNFVKGSDIEFELTLVPS